MDYFWHCQRCGYNWRSRLAVNTYCADCDKKSHEKLKAYKPVKEDEKCKKCKRKLLTALVPVGSVPPVGCASCRSRYWQTPPDTAKRGAPVRDEIEIQVKHKRARK